MPENEYLLVKYPYHGEDHTEEGFKASPSKGSVISIPDKPKVKGKKIFEKALKIDPKSVNANGGMALLHIFYNRYDEAYQLISPIIKKGILNSTLAIAYAQICKHFNKCEEAVKYINQVEKLPSASKQVKRLLGF